MASGDALKRLQALFRELFQLDLADLDFGIYRLFHLKRAEMERWLDEQLPREVDAAFRRAADQEHEQLKTVLEQLAQNVRQQIAEDAILPNGEVNPQYQTIKLVKQYAELKKKLADADVMAALREEVFNHLYQFFSRYYEDGDFIPKRRYGAEANYAVPYNGEEVFFTWANRDQHYVKTGETFKEYAFKVRDLAGEYRVRFTMAKALTPKENLKGKTRYFFPLTEQAVYDDEAKEYTLPFEYRPLTEEEAKFYGNHSQVQDMILQEALPAILRSIPEENIRELLAADQRSEKEKAEGKPELPLLLKRLSHYCRRNTSDYFVHKNLRGFLQRELEFYIKDNMLHLMDLEADWEIKRRVLQVFRRLADKVIEFLAHMEEVQKRLFEKKKLILGVDYLIPIQYVPRAFWPEILANERQREEWRQWFALEPEDESVLEQHPTLPVHTRHFSRAFVQRLIEALPFDNLDEATDGLLVHGENLQALHLLMERYKQQVKCVYIDPPYNTGDSEILYKNQYKHSSWLTLLYERLRAAQQLLDANDPVLYIAIDDYELVWLCAMLDSQFPAFRREMIVVNHHPQGGKGKTLANTHEYMIALLRNDSDLTLRGRVVNDDVEYRPFKRSGTAESNFRYARPNSFYALLVDPKTKQVVGSEPPPPLGSPYPTEPFTKEGWLRIYPIGADGQERVWRRSYEKCQSLIDEGKLICSESGTIYQIIASGERTPALFTNWVDPRYNAGTYGANLLRDMMGAQNAFSYPKSVYTVEDAIFALGDPSEPAVVLDFFAGSGTTGHAVINLNREDGGERQFILVEMGEHFDSVLLPRIAKVMFAPEWKNGRPKRLPTPQEAARSPRLVKILRLESYEDALHNLASPTTVERAAVRDKAIRELVGEDHVLLRYWTEGLVQEAETCLRALDLRHPFRYSLEVLTEDGPVKKPVDLVETFNYLYGLRVIRYATWENEGRAYRVVKATNREGTRRILVIWRDMEGLDVANERVFLQDRIRDMERQGESWDEIWINGDSMAPGVQSLDPLFKALMMHGTKTSDSAAETHAG